MPRWLVSLLFAIAFHGIALAEEPFASPAMTRLPDGPPPFEYVDVGAKIPNYVVSEKWGEQGEPQRMMQKPLAPEESLKRMAVPEGFHVELFAAEPDLGGKPIAMAWDARGRLWVAETMDYPNELQPPGGGRDRIRICEDTDDDGRADKCTVFAEGLSIPTSIAFAFGGAVVHNGIETLFLRDTDGDDRADERRVLLAGWAMNDTHGGPSNLQYGLDNWLWGMQGYNKSTITIGGVSTSFAQGFHRFRPDGSAIEFIRSTNNNTWGLGMSEEGIVFGSTANGHPSIYMPIPNRHYERVRGWTPRLVLETIADSNRFRPITDKVRQVDHHGGYTAGAGHALYTARAYPQPWWNRTAFVCGPTGHLVGTFALSREGADFHATSPCNLLASDDEWTAPIMAEVGPDGHVWVIDWYNYIVQHNPTPRGFATGKGNAYETDLRDKRHGRIYRVVYDAAPKVAPLDLIKATPDELVATLKNNNLLWRRHAQRLLVERGQRDVVPQLIALVQDTSTDAIGLNVGAIHALWTLHGLGAFDEPESRAEAVAALRHPSAGVRRNAVQVLPHDSSSVAALLDADLLHDADAQVRLMALLALADMPGEPSAARAIAAMLERPENAGDRWIPDAATCAAARQGTAFLIVCCRSPDASEKALEVARRVAEHVARSGVGAGVVGELLAELVRAKPQAAEVIVAGLAAGWSADRPLRLDPAAQQHLVQLLETAPLSAKGAIALLARRWGSDALAARFAALAETMIARVGDASLDPAQRIAAAREAVALAPRENETVQRLLEAVTPQMPSEVAQGIFRAMERSDAEQAGSLLTEHLKGQSPTLRAAGIDVLLNREPLTESLLEALDRGDIPLSELDLSQKRNLAEHPVKSLRERAAVLLARGGAIPNTDRQKVIDQFASLATTTGDASAGKAVFKQHCAKCHVHSGEGTHVGPELTGMAVHPKSELLIQILDPSRSVEGNFRQYTVQQVDGRVLAGMLAGESATAIDLIDAEGKRHAILREDIEELIASTKSLMPDGFEQSLQRDELANLLEFLTTRGQFLPLDLRKVATASSDRPMFFHSSDGGDRLLLDDWAPRSFNAVPFSLIDPQQGRVANVIVLRGPQGDVAPTLPRAVELPCHTAAKAIHFLSGVSGWGFPLGEKGSVSLVVCLHYADGETERHALHNGVHFADYIRRVDVPESEFAFSAGERQIRYLKIEPHRQETIERIELRKGDDASAPIVLAVTVETQ